MSKTRIFALLGIVIMLTAVFTNPSKEKINDKLTLKAKEILKNQLDYKHKDAVDFGMMLFGDQVVKEFVNNYTHTDNYYLFSLTKINWNSEEVVIGGGAFGQVWISDKIDEKAGMLMDALKNQ
ncbi:DUF4359 domain-containing protein [Sphingobacterium daejeonense]|uniref:DUF4359 domain-containing protein n=1 Tax=Sphingobacterium daejeonense TaxID=371142 RepID=A0ABW3RGR0_9SPHI|nr:DUF4359 domain-containing protein [Sphingobacterium daejeonense]VTP86173.1 Uncharacterised protein [Sphingobacterium daejeonense]